MLTESLYPSIMQMVSANVCRALPPPTDDFDPEEDEPVLELSWPHLQVRHADVKMPSVSGAVVYAAVVPELK